MTNLLLNEKMEVKICDFGLASKINFPGEIRRSFCGTPNYIAPEVLNGIDGHSFEVDAWAIGIVLY